MFSLSGLNRPTKLALLGMIAFVGIVSCIIVLAYNDYFFLGDPIKPNNDDVKYIQTSRLLLNEGVLAYNTKDKPSAFIMPGLPFILAGFMAIFGQDQGGVIAYRIFQCLQQAFCIYLIFWIGRRIFNTRVALIACAISTIYLPDYFSSGVILSETTFRTIILLLVCVTILAIEQNRSALYLLIGVLTAAAAYFKPHASLYPAVFLVLWWKQKIPLRVMLKYTIIMAATYVVLLTPWWIRNWITFHEFILFTNSGGSPFLLGTRIYGQLPPAGFFEEYPQYDPQTLFQGSDSTAIQKGLDIISYGFRHEPLKYLYWFTLGRWVELYFHPFYSRPIWPVTRPLMNVLQVILMLINMVGIVWALLKHQFTRLLPLLLALGYFTVIYVPFVAFNRYGYPNMVLLIMFGAYAIDQVLNHFIKYPSDRLEGRRTSAS
ncbi:4-amino-4-deoxy-L-arabinose transferase-like glycosyltransferase [Paenibacillus anaericanus]|uniref:ArnT family glycosyltransferase n=1 Tax=Paenibacillus anaericanus TaxID=170367 RepID=UPI0027842223|nr:glycosyltransferase family 39 protein [Paenibacillus anaericanus]MDQ0089773.1 4-amino-4-deoxy-L-arabinose transferase-like glycosyltransferase [Paenibacillus anaericanus]